VDFAIPKIVVFFGEKSNTKFLIVQFCIESYQQTVPEVAYIYVLRATRHFYSRKVSETYNERFSF
jgi:hypothetical protein